MRRLLKGQRVWLAGPAYPLTPDSALTDCYFDFISDNGNYCFQRVRKTPFGLVTQYAASKKANKDTHLILTPAELETMQLFDQESDALLVKHTAIKRMQQQVYVQWMVAKEREEKEGRERLVYVTPKMAIAIREVIGVDCYSIPIPKLLAKGLSRSRLRRIKGVGETKLDELNDEFKRRGFLLPD
ncbi:MAG: hypothetical protein EOO39_00465 [Cytophagaceae bacterium]|nr:MAG: hypothetical protein EOO39_00465 [Cytophagaceae bacterium]